MAPSFCHLSRFPHRPILKQLAHRILLPFTAHPPPPLSHTPFLPSQPLLSTGSGSTPSDNDRYCEPFNTHLQKESSVHSGSASNGSSSHCFLRRKEVPAYSRIINGEARSSLIYRSPLQQVPVARPFSSSSNGDQNIGQRTPDKGEKNLPALGDNFHRKDQTMVDSNPFWSRLKSAMKNATSMTRNDWSKKLTQWKTDIMMTLKHYWVGSKLLGTDMKISSKLLLKLARGDNLGRRERHQLKRTTSDMVRLVPFVVIVIVPFMELLLPVLLKVFPNMLPSTFQNKNEEAKQRILNARRQYAMLLQDIVKEMANEIKSTQTGDSKKTAENLDEFMNKVRTGGAVSNEEILGFAKLFKDEITLENISRPRLISMCKYMGIKPYGTDSYLRYMLQSKLARLKNDDRLIESEGLNSLSTVELENACRDRAILGVLTEEEMRKQLKDWLDLSLKFSVPSSLLILSRAFTASGKTTPEDAVQATLSSLPDEVIAVVSVSSLPSESKTEEHIQKSETIKLQDRFVKKAEEKCEEGKTK